MNLLPVLPTSYIMDRSLSLTGVTILKKYRYYQRYRGNREFVHSPGIGFDTRKTVLQYEKAAGITIKDTKKAPPTKGRLTKAGVKLSTNNAPARTNIEQRFYTIKKSLIRNRIYNFINQQQGGKQLFFWTISFPIGTTDDIGYKLFNIWLTVLRQSHNLRTYLWVAERQQNETIHFHLAMPQRICVFKANRAMRVSICNEVRRGALAWNLTAAKRYNGVDIDKDRKTGRVTNFACKKGRKALSNYMVKYLTKNDSFFTHLAWHNSRDISAMRIGVNVTQQEYQDYKLERFINEKCVYENEFITFYSWKGGEGPPGVKKHLAGVNMRVLDLMGKK